MSGSSCAAHAICARATNGLSGFTTTASAGRSSSSAGWRAYHWSSWSSPAISTAAARRVVRPARPTCWRIDASVPGKPLSTTASSAADVDAELERAGGDHAAELAARELRLELTSFGGEVAGAVRGHRRAGCRRAPSALRAWVATSSAPLRLRVNASVWWPSATKRESTIAVSAFADARVPECTSTSGRCHTAKRRSACGEPSPSIASTGRPHRREASSAGLPMVALVKQNVGDDP